MNFEFPAMEHKERAEDYIREFIEVGSRINGVGGLHHFLKAEGYEAWPKKLLADLDIANWKREEGEVPAYTYFYVREEDGKIIGMVNLRLCLDDFLDREAGHIGYSIRPSERRRGYGSRMLQDALAIYKSLGIERVLVCCEKINTASAGLIQKNGGKLQNESVSVENGEIVQRYWIKTKKGRE